MPAKPSWITRIPLVVKELEALPRPQIAPPPERRPIRWGAMRDRIKLPPGWDNPITEEQLFGAGSDRLSA